MQERSQHQYSLGEQILNKIILLSILEQYCCTGCIFEHLGIFWAEHTAFFFLRRYQCFHQQRNAESAIEVNSDGKTRHHVQVFLIISSHLVYLSKYEFNAIFWLDSALFVQFICTSFLRSIGKDSLVSI